MPELRWAATLQVYIHASGLLYFRGKKLPKSRTNYNSRLRDRNSWRKGLLLMKVTSHAPKKKSPAPKKPPPALAEFFSILFTFFFANVSRRTARSLCRRGSSSQRASAGLHCHAGPKLSSFTSVRRDSPLFFPFDLTNNLCGSARSRLSACVMLCGPVQHAGGGPLGRARGGIPLPGGAAVRLRRLRRAATRGGEKER
jgi:hypothetical protein